MKARGYTMLEIAITLTVIALLSSALLYNYLGVQKDERNQEAARHLSQFKTAVVNYAAQPATAQRFVQVFNLSVDSATPSTTSTVAVRHRLPAGRPYLPCPDITGDGREDRISPPNADDAISLTLTSGMAHPDNVDYILETAGGCVSSHGVVPWRTLDAPAADPWGNRYSYRVAGVFSNAQTGFDQHSQGGARYAARPLIPTGGTIFAATLSVSDHTMTPLTSSGPWTTAFFRNYLSPFVICATSPCLTTMSVSATDLVAGEIMTTMNATITLSFPLAAADFGVEVESQLTAGDLISGVPFVVLSHGANGRGGVRADTPGYVCNPFPPLIDGGGTLMVDNSALLEESQNAAWFATIAITTGGLEYRCASGPDSESHPTGIINGINDLRTRNSPDDGYDDIVDWMSASELIAALSELGALPANPPPLIGLER